MSRDSSSTPSFLLAELEQAVLHVLDRRRVDLRNAAASRTSVEKLWFRTDLEQELRTRPHVTVTAQTPHVVDARTKRVDLVFSAGDLQLLVELKTLITNYGQAARTSRSRAMQFARTCARSGCGSTTERRAP